MAYSVFLDGVLLPVAPSKIRTKIKNQNKTINLINDGEINFLKSAGLTEISFEVLIPAVKYPFAVYNGGFLDQEFFLGKLEFLKELKKPFQFIVSRDLFNTNMKVSLEDYEITEDAKNSFDLLVSVNLKQYKDYKTEIVNVDQQAPSTATVQNIRPAESAPQTESYKVQSGDTLWNIAKKYLGNGSRYSEIANLNKISNPNLISVGQTLRLPS